MRLSCRAFLLLIWITLIGWLISMGFIGIHILLHYRKVWPSSNPIRNQYPTLLFSVYTTYSLRGLKKIAKIYGGQFRRSRCNWNAYSCSDFTLLRNDFLRFIHCCSTFMTKVFVLPGSSSSTESFQSLNLASPRKARVCQPNTFCGLSLNRCSVYCRQLFIILFYWWPCIHFPGSLSLSLYALFSTVEHKPPLTLSICTGLGLLGSSLASPVLCMPSFYWVGGRPLFRIAPWRGLHSTIFHVQLSLIILVCGLPI